jgi:hypothetical protein
MRDCEEEFVLPRASGSLVKGVVEDLIGQMCEDAGVVTDLAEREGKAARKLARPKHISGPGVGVFRAGRRFCLVPSFQTRTLFNQRKPHGFGATWPVRCGQNLFPHEGIPKVENVSNATTLLGGDKPATTAENLGC